MTNFNLITLNIMLQLNPHELLHLRGGSASASWSCAQLLQYEAATHKKSSNKDWENEYWDDWSRRYEECAESLQ